MPILSHIPTGALTEPIPNDSDQYRTLIAQRDDLGHTLWEDTGVEDVEASDLPQVLFSRVLPAALTADVTTVVGTCSHDGTLLYAEYYPDAAVTGTDTNSRTLSVVDVTGTVTLASLALVSTVNLAVGDTGNELTVISDADVAKNDVLHWVSTHVLTGLVDPGGFVVLIFSAV